MTMKRGQNSYEERVDEEGQEGSGQDSPIPPRCKYIQALKRDLRSVYVFLSYLNLLARTRAPHGKLMVGSGMIRGLRAREAKSIRGFSRRLIYRRACDEISALSVRGHVQRSTFSHSRAHTANEQSIYADSFEPA